MSSGNRAKPHALFTFLRMYTRWLSPKTLRAQPLNMPPQKAMELASAYSYCFLCALCFFILLPLELCLRDSVFKLIPLIGLLPVSILCCLFVSRTGKTPPGVLTLAGYIFFISIYYTLDPSTDESIFFYYYLTMPAFVFGLHWRFSVPLCLSFLAMLWIFFLPDIPITAHFNAKFRVNFVASITCVYIISALAERILIHFVKDIFALHKRLEQFSLTDPLTGQGNRRNCINQYERLYALFLRSRASFSLIILDIDHFKVINDTYGHPAGDEVLRYVAQKLQATLRRQDRLFRWGGEEFAVILPDARQDQATIAAERMRQALADTPVPLGETLLQITASFGVHVVTEEATMEEHVRRADELLYRAKNNGRNCVVNALTPVNKDAS